MSDPQVVVKKDVDGGYEELGADPVSRMIFVIFVGLALGQILNHISHWTRIPAAPMMVLLGIIVSVASRAKYATVNSLGVGHSYLIKILMIPALVFGQALKTDWIIFRQQFISILILSVPMFISCVFLTAAVFWGVLQYRTVLSFREALLFSVIIWPYGSVIVQKVCT